MWPFPKLKEKYDRSIAFKELESIAPIGTKFSYCGRECIVTATWTLIPMIGVVPMLLCDYADNQGVIRHIEFTLGEAKRLLCLPELAKESK